MNANEDALGRLDRFIGANSSISFIRVQWLDYHATLRGRVLTVAHFRDLLGSGQFHYIGPILTNLPNGYIPRLQSDPKCAIGRLALVPDLSTLNLVPWHDGHASVMCYIGDERAGKMEIMTSVTSAIPLSPLCPRNALITSVDRAQKQNISVLVGLEIEFVVFTEDVAGNTKVLDNRVHLASSMCALEHRMLPLLDNIVLNLARIGIAVLHYETESATGQFELVLAPMPPMMAADALVIARECIRAECRRHGLLSTLHPSCPGGMSGLHVHISASGPGCDTPEDRQAFLAGMLNHLPALCAFGMTTPMSYVRTQDSHCGCGRWVTWGTANRQTVIRGISDNHWEVRAVDGLSNIYLVIAAYLRCALDGVASVSPLRHKDCPSKFNPGISLSGVAMGYVITDTRLFLADPASLDAHDRAELNIDEEMPKGVIDALARLGQDQLLCQNLGSPLIDAYSMDIRAYSELLQNIADKDGDHALLDFIIRRF